MVCFNFLLFNFNLKLLFYHFLISQCQFIGLISSKTNINDPFEPKELIFKRLGNRSETKLRLR